MKKSKVMKFIATILTLATIFSFTQVGAYALTDELRARQNTDENEIKVLSEIEEERTENSKTFHRSDGKIVSVSTLTPLHFRNDDNKWEEINNTLENRTGESTLKNTANNLEVEFPKLLDSDSKVSVKKDEHKVSFRLLETKSNSYFKIIENNRPINEEGTIAEKLNKVQTESKVKYSEVINNTDIIYDIVPNGIKESIIIKSKPSEEIKYEYEISSGDLVPILNEDNTIEFFSIDDKETPVFVMPAPFMFDGSDNAELNYDVAIELKQNEDGKHIMTYSPSYEWLNDISRIYPITLDPTIQKYTPASVLKYGMSSSVGENQTNLDSPITVHGLNKDAIFLDWNHTTPKDMRVVDANLVLKLDQFMTTSEDEYIYLIDPLYSSNDKKYSDYFKNISSDYLYGSAEEMNENIGKTISKLPFSVLNNSLGKNIFPFSVTEQVKDGNINFAITIDGYHRYNYMCLTYNNSYPYLEVEYESVSGYNSQQDIQEIEIGRAGTGYINNFTGKVSYSRVDQDYSNDLLPFENKTYYDEYNKEEVRFSDINLMVEKMETGANSELPYYFSMKDEYGATLLFYHNSENEDENAQFFECQQDTKYVIKETDGELSLIKNEHEVFKFSKVGNKYYSISISVNKQDDPIETQITRNATTQKITKVKDPFGKIYNVRDISVKYNGKSSKVFSEVKYAYSNNNKNLQVTYSDGESAYYEYNSDGKVTKITDIDGYSIVFAYGVDGRLTKITEYASDGTAGNWQSYSYSNSHLTITNSQNKTLYKTYDKYGNIINTLDNKGRVVDYTFVDNERTIIGDLLPYGSAENNLLGNTKEESNKGWTNKAIASEVVSNNQYVSSLGTNIIKVSSKSEDYVQKNIKIDGKVGDAFAYGVWTYGQSDAISSLNSELNIPKSRGMEIWANNPKTGQLEKISFFNFESHIDIQQYKTESFTLPFDAEYILVRLANQNNYIYSDAYFSYPELEFLSLGNIIEDDSNVEESQVEEKSKLDSYGREIEVKKGENTFEKYEYDSAGNVIKTEITDNEKSIIESKTYDLGTMFSTGTLKAFTDNTGAVTKYFHESNTGNLGTVMEPSNRNTMYKYNEMRQVTSAESPVSELYDGKTTIANTYAYKHDKLKTISNGNSIYNFDYDKWGNQTGVRIGDKMLITDKYIDNHFKLIESSKFANGQQQLYSYNNDHQLTGIKFSGDLANRFSYTYYEDDQIKRITDNSNSRTTDISDKTTSIYNTQNNGLIHSYTNENDKLSEQIGSKRTEYIYDSDQGNKGRTISTSYEYLSGKNAISNNVCDNLERVNSNIISIENINGKENIIKQDYIYRDIDDNQTTRQLQDVKYTYGNSSNINDSYSYTYDAAGNIKTISLNGRIIKSYTYDKAYQLTRENDKQLGKTFVYKYDSSANIREKVEYAYTTGTLGSIINTIVYSYDDANWSDKLTSYNGKNIEYDESGNPLSYDGWSYIWEGGRQLKRMSKNGSTLDYKYDATGIRIQKVHNGKTTNYTHIDGKITSEEIKGEYIYYRYDKDDKLISLNYKGTEYFYIINNQNDVIGIVDEKGNKVVEYTYDAWGKHISITGTLAGTLGQANSMRYRSYYFDIETGLYYLQSRYYNPEFGRFINADTPEMLNWPFTTGDIIGVNLFSYCLNNPIMSSDSTGFWVARVVVAAASGAIFGGIAYAIGKALKIKGKALAGLVAGFTAIGIALGAWKGVTILKTINSLIKPVIYFFSNPNKVYFGLKLLSIIQFEIHAPHHNKPIHFVVRVFLKTGQKAWEWWFKR